MSDGHLWKSQNHKLKFGIIVFLELSHRSELSNCAKRSERLILGHKMSSTSFLGSACDCDSTHGDANLQNKVNLAGSHFWLNHQK